MKIHHSIYLLILFFVWSCTSVKPVDSNNPDPSSQSAHLNEVPATVNDSVRQIRQSAAIGTQPSREINNDIRHTRLEIKFDWEKQYVIGKAILEVAPYFYPTDILELDAKGFEIIGANLLEDMEKIPLDYEYDEDILTIDLDSTYEEDQHYFVEIDYIAKPGDYKAGTNTNKSDRGLYFINPTGEDPDKPRQIWTQGETEANSVWFPTIDSPNEKFTQEILVTVDQQFTTLSNGILVYSLINDDSTRTDYWQMELPHPAYLTMLAVGEFSIVEDSWENENGELMEVSYYVEPEYESYAEKIFGNTPEMISFYSQILDYPYPWPKYSQIVVRDFVSGAMENTTASVFMEDLQVPESDLIDYNWDDIIAHELFHHWFGDLVTCESWANLPLNESFATYGEYLWYEYKYGIEEADYLHWESLETYMEEADEKKVDLIRYRYEDREDMFDSHSYQKGSMVLHMLRNYVGDRAFFTALNHYLVYNEYGTVEIHDLRLAFEEVTGEDLNWFFNQWFLSSGHPELTIEQHLDDGVLTVEVTQTQEEPSPIFFLPVNIRCWTSEDDFWDLPVEISDSYQKFEFDIDEPVKLVLFDSEQQLLAKVNHQKSLEEWIFQYYYGEKLMARYGALEQLGELALESPEQYDTVTTVYLNALVEDPFWGIRELAAEFFDEYTGPFIDEVNERLEKIALEDKKSQVRASALTSLISENPDDHKPLILKCMEDSSYMVKGAAILAYSATNDINKVKVLDQYKEDKNSHIVFALAEFYSSENQFDNSTWFLDRMKKATTEDLFYLLQYYGVFLSQAGIPQEKLDEGMEFLKQKALAHPIVFIRLAAFQSLQILPATETQKSIIEEIKRNETSEDLLKLYNGNN